MTAEILFVDDEPEVLAGFQRVLRKDFKIDIATGGEEALAAMAQRPPYAVVVADMRMPGLNGIDFLIKLEGKAPDTVRIMLTGNADQQTARDAINHGHIFRFLTKPCPPDELISALRAGLRQYQLITAERELLENTLHGSVKALSDILAMHDPDSFGRGQRLSQSMRSVANFLQLKPTWELELGAMLSQIGYVAVPVAVLEKARANYLLSPQEKDMIARAPLVGSNLLTNISRLETVAKIVLYQHKNFDGSGYPCDGVAGEQIPLGARILRILHDLQAAEASGKPTERAMSIMRKSPELYDPTVLEAIAASLDIFFTARQSDEAPTRAVSVKDLHVGDVLKSPAHTKDGVPIAPSGVRVSPILLEKLRNFADLDQLAEPILILAV
ncbi:MAG TPA: HD domain-containing phosphohydrolase [Verrucomicrobiae bacterium]|jgi:response regulator RpfG family c-di-GMP phosphodiesterase|nr:HD domain-containing phosphohydrolase [Verrucomicrobiae bacterium]